MKMKKILCVLLALIMILSLGACSQKEEPGPTQPEPDFTISTDRKLIFKEFGIPVVEPFEYVHETIAGSDRMYTTTCFDFDMIDMYAALQNSSFFSSSNGRNLTMTTGEDAMFYHPDFPMYDFYNGVYCELGGTDEKPDMTISLDSIWQTTYFTNPNGIRLTMTYNPEVAGYVGMIQDYPYEVLATIIGAEFANFVVYAKDSDGLDYIYEESILPTDLSDNADAGNGCYRFCRTFAENKVTYEIFFEEGFALSDHVLIGRPVENTTYETLPYKLDSILSDKFGGTNPADIYTFGNKMFTSIYPEFKTVLVPSIYHSKTIQADKVLYNVEFVIEIPETETYLDFLTTYTMSEGELIESDAAWYISIDRAVDISEMTDNKEVEEATQAEIQRLIQVAKLILPDIEFTKIDTKDLSYKYQIDYTLFGESVSKTCEFLTTLNSVELSVELNNAHEHNHNHNHNH